MPKVSILLTTLRPYYLDLAIASALAQTYRDFELLIGDDCEDNQVESVVSKWEDPRIRYSRNPKKDGHSSNRDYLLRSAAGEYVKFLHDDDYLHPKSLELLVAAAEATRAGIAFHGRYRVDASGCILAAEMDTPANTVKSYGSHEIMTRMVAGASNFIGEPSNILVDTRMFRDSSSAYAIGGRKLVFMEDVPLFVNAVASGMSIVGCGWFCSSYRVHGSQMSTPTSSVFSAALFEWEYLNRWAIDEGLLADTHFQQLALYLRSRYQEHTTRYPELSRFLQVGTTAVDGKYLTDPFLEALDLGWADIENRHRGSRRQVLAAI